MMKPKAKTKAKTTRHDPSPLEILERERRRGQRAAARNGAGPHEPVEPERPLDTLNEIFGVWAVRPVDQQPHIDMVRWRVFEVLGHRVLFGYSITTREGRRSSRIVTFDPSTMRVMTDSGRVYQLSGPPGYDDDAQHVLEVSSLAADYKDVTDMVCAELGISISPGERIGTH